MTVPYAGLSGSAVPEAEGRRMVEVRDRSLIAALRDLSPFSVWWAFQRVGGGHFQFSIFNFVMMSVTVGQFVIACYRPKEGHEEHLLEEVRRHVPTLREQGLVTDRPPYLMRSKDRTIIEVFEWASEDAVRAAHRNPVVAEMWKRFEESCDYVALNHLEEATLPFAPFDPVEL